MAQKSLYYQTQLTNKVSLLPQQITADMDKHMLDNLKTKIEKKSTEHGIILNVNRLIDYKYGMIDKANFMGTTVYEVDYECFVCSPTKDLEIICVLENIIKGYLIGKNGPVVVAIQFNNIDTEKFEIVESTLLYKKDKHEINKGDYLKVTVIGVNNDLGEESIVTVCKLLDIANKDEIKRFKEEQYLVTSGTTGDTKEFI